jgi:peptidoglycan/xylan/chitin deacetylase (PgdA/CDA1 family)
MPRRLTKNVREPTRFALAFGLRWRARLSSAAAGVVLVYHGVGGQAADDPNTEIVPGVPAAAFRRQLRHLRRHYRVVPAARIVEAARIRRRGQPLPVAITFDDDLASHLRDALPALRGEGLTATFFLSGCSLREAHPFWWEDLQAAIDGQLVTPEALAPVPEDHVRAALEREPKAIRWVASAIERLEPAQRGEVEAALRAAVGEGAVEPGLRAPDVRALVDGGCDVGFHTLRHDALPALADDELERAMRDGREALATAAGAELDLIAYPHGKADARVGRAASAAGFSHGFTTVREVVRPDTDPHLVPRLVPALSAGALALRLARAFARGE